nr:predicted protein [Arabidopsis thaliana]
MTIGYRDAAGDPLFPWLMEIKNSMEDLYAGKNSGYDLDKLLFDCISTYKKDSRYRNDLRFLKIWEDFERVYREIEETEICKGHSLLYEWYAIFLEVKGLWRRANSVYQTGLSRKAEPFDRLKEAHSLFLQRISKRTKASSLEKVGDDAQATDLETGFVNPWETSTVNGLIHKIKPQLVKYDGYHVSNKVFPGKANLSSLQNYSRNKIIEIGILFSYQSSLSPLQDKESFFLL